MISELTGGKFQRATAEQEQKEKMEVKRKKKKKQTSCVIRVRKAPTKMSANVSKTYSPTTSRYARNQTGIIPRCHSFLLEICHHNQSRLCMCMPLHIMRQ